MRVTLSLLLLFATVYSGINALGPRSALIQRQNSDSQVIAHFSTVGLCFSYISGSGKNRDKTLAPCKVWCEKKGSKSYGCRGPSIPIDKIDPSTVSKDDDGNRWTPGECECNFEIVEEIVDVVIEGLSKLDNVLCAVMLSSLTTIAEVGINFVPGGQVGTGVRLAVQGAKSFFENGMEASSFFGDWVGKSCGVDNWNFDLMSVFKPLVNAPDSVGTSIGCKKKNKSDCKKLDPKSDPKTADKPTDMPTKKPATTTNPKISKTDKSTSTTTAPACKLGKRADPKPKEGVLGAEEKREEECNRQKTIHITKTDKVIGWYTTEIPATCSKKYAQACYHYRSVMSVHTKHPDMVRWTCQMTTGTNKDGSATSTWGNTAIAKIGGGNQHWWPWANGFVPRVVIKNHEDKENIKGCDRDEFPPRAFWPGDVEAKKKGMVQRVRFIKYTDNAGAGQMWQNFCNGNAAASISNVKKKRKTYIQSKHIRTVGKPRDDKTVVGKDKITTIITSVSVNTARAIFTIKDWDGLPEDKDWHGLKQNPCWPKLLAPEDPGWALLTDDEFYKLQHPDLAKYTARYREYPDMKVLERALKDGGGEPPYPFSSINADDYRKRFKNGIEKGYIGVLPGIPLIKLPRRSVAARRNITDAKGDTADNILWDASDNEIDSYNEEELDQWMEEYAELERRQYVEPSPTTPPQTEAQPTPAGQGDATAVPAIEGSLATAGLPQATRAPI